MFEIDGKKIDLANLAAMGVNIQFKPGGFIEQRKDGVTVRLDEKGVTEYYGFIRFTNSLRSIKTISKKELF